LHIKSGRHRVRDARRKTYKSFPMSFIVMSAHVGPFTKLDGNHAEWEYYLNIT